MTVPVRIAQAATETGAVCLGMVLADLGRRVGQEELRVACGVSRDGTDLQVLAAAAETFGCDARVTDVDQSDPAALEAALASALPVIAEWANAHVVVIEGYHRDSWQLVDPLAGRTSVSTADVLDHVGRVLSITPGPTFERGGSQPRISPVLTDGVAGSWRGVGFVALAGVALVVPGLLAPAFVRTFVDSYLTDGSTSKEGEVVAGLVVTFTIGVVLLTLQRLGLRRLLTATVTRTSSHFLWHLMRMPAWFYSQRDATTLAYRMGLNEKLADTLSGQFSSAVLAQVTSVFYLIAMFVFSPLLALVGLLGLVIALALIAFIARLRMEVRQRQAREAAVTATQLGVSLRMLETLKATGSEDVAFTRIYAAMGRRLSLGYTHLWGYLAMIPVLAQGIAGALVLGLGAALVMRGSLTVGTLTAFTLLLGGFLAPISALIPSLDSALNLRGTLDQVDDVMAQDVDPALWDDYADGPRPHAIETSASSAPSTDSDASLVETSATTSSSEEPVDDMAALLAAPRSRGRRSGGLTVDPWAASLELDHVSFGYSSSGPPLLQDVSLTINPGRIVAVVGASGSGKSTIGRLVAGLYRPSAGRVLLDGRDLLDHPSAQRARDLAFVDQDVVLYRASVRDNITMFSPDVPDREVVEAAVDALIHDEILARPGGYDAPVAEDGRDRSGGQRQRMIIARAFVRQPRLIVFDEATSALDARTEAGIVESLRRRACTALVIAHRLSTVRDADEIIVLDAGRVAERGTHRQLAASDGLYRRLMDA